MNDDAAERTESENAIKTVRALVDALFDYAPLGWKYDALTAGRALLAQMQARAQAVTEPVAHIRAKASLHRWDSFEICPSDDPNARPVYSGVHRIPFNVESPTEREPKMKDTFTLNGLAALASAASPGPWSLAESGNRISVKSGLATVAMVAVTNVDKDANAAFIAACDPTSVLALVEVAKAAKAHIAALDALQNTPVGEFTGNEVPTCDEAEAALRSAIEGMK